MWIVLKVLLKIWEAILGRIVFELIKLLEQEGGLGKNKGVE